MKWLAKRSLKLAKRLHLWAAMQLIDAPDLLIGFDPAYDGSNLTILPNHMKAAARLVIERELDQVLVTGRLAAFNQITETEILDKRLARRYDPGMAMNEAFERAAKNAAEARAKPSTPAPPGEDEITAYYRQMREHPPELTPKQQAALDVQKKTLRQNLGG